MKEIRQVQPPTIAELAEKYPKKFDKYGIINKSVDMYSKKRKKYKAKIRHNKVKPQKRLGNLKTNCIKKEEKRLVHIPEYINTWFADGFHNKDGCGFVVCDANKEIMAEMINVPDYWTNNQCEYEAVIHALTIIPDKALLCSDSQLVVNQVNGLWDCNFKHLIPLRNKCRELMKINRVKLLWIRREQNLSGQIIEDRQKDKSINV